MFETWLLAAADLGEAFRSHTRKPTSLGDNWFLIVAVAVIAAVWIGLHFWDKYRKRQIREGNNPKSLFLELCQAHNLSRGERSLLSQLATDRQLPQAGILFVDPGLLQSAAKGGASSRQEYAALARKLFGQS